MPKLLPRLRIGRVLCQVLVLCLASFMLVKVGPTQTLSLDDFSISSDEAATDGSVDMLPDSDEVVVPESGVIPSEDLTDWLDGNQDDKSEELPKDPPGNTLPGNEDMDNAFDNVTDIDDGGARSAAEVEAENQGADVADQELQPIPIPESLADLAETDERASGVQPSSWQSCSGGPIASHWVRLSPSGDLRGEVSLLQAGSEEKGMPSVDVAIYRNGKRVGETKTDSAGNFTFPDVNHGVYALMVSGPSGFAAYGVHVLAPSDRLLGEVPVDSDPEEQVSQSRKHSSLNDFVQFAQIDKDDDAQAGEDGDMPEKNTRPRRVPETLRISTAAVPSSSFNVVRTIMMDYERRLGDKVNEMPEPISPDAWDDLIATAIEQKQPGFDEAEGPEMYRGTRQLERNPIENHVRSAALGNFNVPLKRCGDQLSMCGRLVGTDPKTGRPIQVAADSTELTLIRNDQRVATTSVKAGGNFHFRGLTPGIYSIVAVGDDGFGAISFRATAPSDSADAKPDVAPTSAGDGEKQASKKESNIRFVQHDLNGGVVTDGIVTEGIVTEGVGIDDGCCCGGGEGVVVSPGFVGGGGGGCAVPLCSDPACTRDAFRFFRPGLIAAGLTVPIVALATDDPVQIGAPVSAGGFTGTAGDFGAGGGGAAGIGLGLGALGVGFAALADDDDPVSPVLP